MHGGCQRRYMTSGCRRVSQLLPGRTQLLFFFLSPPALTKWKHSSQTLWFDLVWLQGDIRLNYTVTLLISWGQDGGGGWGGGRCLWFIIYSLKIEQSYYTLVTPGWKWLSVVVGLDSLTHRSAGKHKDGSVCVWAADEVKTSPEAQVLEGASAPRLQTRTLLLQILHAALNALKTTSFFFTISFLLITVL